MKIWFFSSMFVGTNCDINKKKGGVGLLGLFAILYFCWYARAMRRQEKLRNVAASAILFTTSNQHRDADPRYYLDQTLTPPHAPSYHLDQSYAAPPTNSRITPRLDSSPYLFSPQLPSGQYSNQSSSSRPGLRTMEYLAPPIIYSAPPATASPLNVFSPPFQHT